jgi:hypothetical protein
MKLGEDHFHSDYYSTVTKKHDKPAMTNTNSDSANANAAKPKEVPSAMPIANGAPIPNSAAVSLGKAADIEVVSAKLIPRSTPTDHDSEKLSQVSSSASGSLKSNSIGGIGDSSPTNSASNLGTLLSLFSSLRLTIRAPSVKRVQHESCANSEEGRFPGQGARVIPEEKRAWGGRQCKCAERSSKREGSWSYY